MKTSKQFRTRLISVLLGLIATLLVAVCFYAGWLDKIEFLSLDFRFRHFGNASDSGQLCIIGIDDGSLESIGQWPWPRNYIADIVKLTKRLGARDILIDLIFRKPRLPDSSAGISDNSEDEALAKACRRNGGVILACFFEKPSLTVTEKKALSQLINRDSLAVSPEQLARMCNVPVRDIRNRFGTLIRLAAREKILKIIESNPSVSVEDVLKQLASADNNLDDALRKEIISAYHYVQSYLIIRDKAGWILKGKLPASVPVLQDNVQMVLPIPKLAASCADAGFVSFNREIDGKVREIALLAYYKKRIYRQIAFATLCDELKFNPRDIKMSDTSLELILSRKKNENISVTVPLTRKGKLIVNWYAPHLEQWQRSFHNMLPAAAVLELAFDVNRLAQYQKLLTSAKSIIVKELLPDRYKRYRILVRRRQLLLASSDYLLNRQFFNSKPVTRPAKANRNGASSASSIKHEADKRDKKNNRESVSPSTQTKPFNEQKLSLKAYKRQLRRIGGERINIGNKSRDNISVLERNVIDDFYKAEKEIREIESQAIEQLNWLYNQVRELPYDKQNSKENKWITNLWLAINKPETIRKQISSLRISIEERKKRIEPMMKDKIVLLGYTASTLADFVSTPVFKECPGIIVHANVLNQILQQSFLIRSDYNSNLLLILIVGMLMSLISSEKSSLEGFAWLVFVLIGFYVLGCWVLFKRFHIIVPLVAPTLAVVFSWISISVYREVTEGRTKRIFANRLKQYTNDSLVKRIIEDPDKLVLVPEERYVSCFFSDLAGFTSLSERLGPEGTVKLLNIYLEHMSEVLDKYQAFINKFQGDGIFAFFNPPLNPQPDYAVRACLAAIDSQEYLPHVQEHLEEEIPSLDRKLTMRIGIGSGLAVVGDCGSARKFDYTCLGDTVNFSSRLESANKFFGTKILICERTKQLVDESDSELELLTRLVGKVKVVGKEQAAVVYELIGRRAEHIDKIEFVELFEQMVRAYWEENFQKADRLITELEKMSPNDKSVDLYRRLISLVLRERDKFNNGVISLDAK